jgi:hypothetical protein
MDSIMMLIMLQQQINIQHHDTMVMIIHIIEKFLQVIQIKMVLGKILIIVIYGDDDEMLDHHEMIEIGDIIDSDHVQKVTMYHHYLSGIICLHYS